MWTRGILGSQGCGTLGTLHPERDTCHGDLERPRILKCIADVGPQEPRILKCILDVRDPERPRILKCILDMRPWEPRILKCILDAGP